MKFSHTFKYKIAVLGFFALFFLFPAISHAATLYWVGGAGDGVTVNANDWNTTNPAACADGLGNATAVPGASDIAVFDADCDSNATVGASWSVAGINMNSGYVGEITQSATTTVGTSDFIQAGGTWTAGAVTFDDNGSFTISGGTFTAPSSLGTFTVAGSFTKSGSPIFTANSGTLTLDGGLWANTSIDASGVTFSSVVISRSIGNSSPTLTIVSGTTIPLGNTPTVSLASQDQYVYSLTNNGTITMGTGTATFTIDGTFTNAGTVTANSISALGTMTSNFTNSGSFSMTGVTAFDFNGDFTNSGTATFSTGASPTITVAGSLTVANTSTFPASTALTLDGGLWTSTSIDASGVTFGSVVISRSSGNASPTLTIVSGTTIPLGNTPTVTLASQDQYVYSLTNNGTITMGTGTATFTIDGTFTNNGAITTKTSTRSGTAINNATNSTVTFIGDGDAGADTQTITSFATTYYNLTVNSTDGTTDVFQLGSSPTVNNNVTVTAGVLSANGYNLNPTGSITVASGAVLRLLGGETTIKTPTLSSGSTVEYVGTSGPYTLKNWGYHHLTINGAATTFNLPATTDVNGNLTITAGTLDATTSSSYSGDGTGGTITYDGAYTIHTFTSSGTFTSPDSRNVETLVVAGGGGGGGSPLAGGGGAGGLLYDASLAVTA